MQYNADILRQLAEIANTVRSERAKRQWSVLDLSAASGVSERTIYNLENGTENCTIYTLLSVCAALGVVVVVD